ncbi:hypothetical protein N8630_03025 [Synechococcus sp. AH-601-C19]|nr:hypothetical protein [Synechococcus sp. AH-601-C19]
MSNARDTAKNLKTGLNVAADGTIIDVQKDGTSVGNIGANGSRAYMSGPQKGIKFGNASVDPCTNTGATADNAYDLGGSSIRYKDLYLGGGAYIGGTGASNKLDDYEEGTFTPALRGTGTAGVVSNGSAYGRYIRIGQMLHFSLHIGVASWSTGPSGSLRIQNMPFTLLGNIGGVGSQCSGAVMHNHINTGGMDLVWYWTHDQTELRMYYCSDNAAWVQQPIYNESQDFYISGTAMVV